MLSPVQIDETRDSQQPDADQVLSLGEIRAFLACGMRWKLQYRQGVLPRLGAGAFFARLMRQMILLAYRQEVTLGEAAWQVWSQMCAPIFGDLHAFAQLANAYAAAGSPRSKAAASWRDHHPEYDRTYATITDFQNSALGHFAWGERQSLASYFLRTRALIAREDDMLFAEPLLIAGERVEMLNLDLLAMASMLKRLTQAEDGQDRHRFVATIDDLHIAATPDIVAHVDGAIYVVDYTTRRPQRADELANDAQLALYYLALQQHQILPPHQPVAIGYIYLGEDTATTVLTQPERLTSTMARFAHQISSVRTLMDAGVVIPQKGIHHFMSPCDTCAVAHTCSA